jgi:transposase
MAKHHDKAFKLDAAKLVVEEGRKMAHVSRELNIPYKTLNNWVKKYKEEREDGFIGSGNLASTDRELYELRTENERLKKERDILKRAMHIFTDDRK